MPSYSPAFKEQAVRRLMPPNSQSIPMVSCELSVTVSTLYAWKRQFESKGFALPAKSSTPDKWNMKSKLAVIIQTASMNEAERAAYCRENPHESRRP
jgi:transposase